jgi:chlorobactene glucosyltransferase
VLYAVLAVLPWVALGVFMARGIREPRELPPARDGGDPPPGGHGSDALPADPAGDPPEPILVSIVVPARNEARNIGSCVGSLTRFEGVPYEVIVVDDGSTDGTGEIARSVEPGQARRLRVVEGDEPPEGWLGKPWACRRGADLAEGRLLLFTDADTAHGPDLLERCLAAMAEDRVDGLSLLGRQAMDSLPERLIQPQVFVLIGLRFRRLDRVLDASRWQEAIANGQYLLVTRDAYDAVGGHDAVRAEVVEDLRLAQELTRAGFRFAVRGAGDALSTRMYTSFREIVEGWTKNLAIGARQAAGWWGPVAVPLILGFVLVAWLLPVGALVAAGVAWWLGPPGWAGPVAVWGGLAGLTGGRIWSEAYARFGVSRRYAALFPLGSLAVAFIALRSWIRGTRRIEWKGRRYGSAP